MEVEGPVEAEMEAKLNELMGRTNNKLRPLGFEIRRQVSEEDGSKYIGVANMKNDQFSRVGTFFHPEQLLFLKTIVRPINLSIAQS